MCPYSENWTECGVQLHNAGEHLCVFRRFFISVCLSSVSSDLIDLLVLNTHCAERIVGNKVTHRLKWTLGLRCCCVRGLQVPDQNQRGTVLVLVLVLSDCWWRCKQTWWLPSFKQGNKHVSTSELARQHTPVLHCLHLSLLTIHWGHFHSTALDFFFCVPVVFILLFHHFSSSWMWIV